MLKSPSLLLLLLLALGCARHLPMPMTAAQLAEEEDGGALVAYLGQRDASSAVCDLGASGPHVAMVNDDVRDELIDALLENRVAPILWRECVDRLLRSADPKIATSLFDAVARSYTRSLGDMRVEYDSTVQGRLSAMHTLLLERRVGVAPHADVIAELVKDIRVALDDHKLGPAAQRYATALIADVEMEQGVRDGQLVDITLLDRLFQQKDEGALRQYSLRLPDAQLREQATRRVVRLHIQASPFAQVRANAAAVEETIMRIGSNPISLIEHRPVRGAVDTSALVVRGVRVRQDLERQTSTLLGDAGEGSGVSVLPQLSLRGALRVVLEGIDQPVTLCAPAEQLDPSPCILANEVKLDSRLVYFDPDGTLRFIEHLPARDAASLAEHARRLVIPVAVDGQRIDVIDWDLQFETPKDLVLGPDGRDDAGPDLSVRVEGLETGRITYAVKRGSQEYLAIVERARASGFHVVSVGADGRRGSDGSSGHDGAAGAPGTGASCPSSIGGNGGRGEDGGAGEDGGFGSAGGRGGNVTVEVVQRGGKPDELLALLQGRILSKGGSGGAGGSGGSGGQGGLGGSAGLGTTCVDSEGHTTFLSGGSPGIGGNSGRSGSSGMSGSDGQPGQITVRVIE